MVFGLLLRFFQCRKNSRKKVTQKGDGGVIFGEKC